MLSSTTGATARPASCREATTSPSLSHRSLNTWSTFARFRTPTAFCSSCTPSSLILSQMLPNTSTASAASPEPVFESSSSDFEIADAFSESPPQASDFSSPLSCSHASDISFPAVRPASFIASPAAAAIADTSLPSLSQSTFCAHSVPSDKYHPSTWKASTPSSPRFLQASISSFMFSSFNSAAMACALSFKKDMTGPASSSPVSLNFSNAPTMSSPSGSVIVPFATAVWRPMRSTPPDRMAFSCATCWAA
mmetsp:Transcript_78/g.157  ORF Transcript_78/g.157 Transcript_78/m.157 type:complete len:251 (-) Transcript_78:207-959(-)